MHYRRPFHGLRQHPGRVRHGLRVLRHRSGRLRTQPGRRRDRRAGRRGHPTRRSRRPARRLSNVVFMGMGEPLANYDRTWAAVARMHDELGIWARATSRSRRSGIVPGIRRLADEVLPVNLAVSLHAANDTLRDELVPINRRYPLGRARSTPAPAYLGAKNRRLSFEWAMIARGERPRRRRRRAGRLRPSAAGPREPHPAQPTPGWPTVGSPPERVRAFRDQLRALGVNATVRANRGTDIDAACGQLRAAHEATPVTIGRRPPQPGPGPPY